jgi:CRP-like cAMP-binding protein
MTAEKPVECCTRLPRGGFLIHAEGELLQYGIPSETIKDTMKLACGVPRTFIVPHYMFDFASGVATADIEFPIYFNYFIKKRPARIICTEKQRRRIETVLSESLFGPEHLDYRHEFAQGENTPGYPDLKTEFEYFRDIPTASGGRLTLDDLVEFRMFDKHGVARFDGIEIRMDRHYYLRVLENGRELVAMNGNDPAMAHIPEVVDVCLDFTPPLFGITTLGAGHGFDPNARTSGIIIWVNRRGIVVDPPVGSTHHLLRLGVSPKLIDKVILTHCHADHDAGTLQKILQEGKINLYTTPTIYHSFLKKSAALTSIRETNLRKMVTFFPVMIGKTMIIDEARFTFNYTLHSIPTIGIQASLYGKNMIYSSDTLNDPSLIEQLFQQGILSQSRRDQLLAFPWNHDVIFHEAGVPPIHTPMEYLCSLPREVRERIYLVHVNPAHIPADSGLRIAPTGLQNTIELCSMPLPHDEAIEILDTFAHVDLFETLPFAKAREVLLISDVKAFRAGETIFSKGDEGDMFYIVIAGEVDIVLDGRIITTYSLGGYFGEKSLFLEETRTASAIARTAARLLCIAKNEMLSLIRGTESEHLLSRIALFQNVELRETLCCNALFRSLTATQQTRVHGLIKPVEAPFPAGTVLMMPCSRVTATFLIRSGEVDVCQDGELITTLGRGDLFLVRALLRRAEAVQYEYVARTEVRLYSIDHGDLIKYSDKNPGFHTKLYHYPY